MIFCCVRDYFLDFMNIINLINKKRLGGRLTNEEIEWVVKNYCKDKIPNYQMSALLMAICNNGFSYEETLAMTLAMKNSGNVYDFDKRESYILDKHSTGGVGDSTTFIMTSILASLGYKVVKMSGRGLGHTGGTLDKLEVFKGVKHNFKLDAVRELLDKNRYGRECAIDMCKCIVQETRLRSTWHCL